MNRYFVFSVLCLIALGSFRLVDVVFAMDSSEIQEENNTYHEQKYTHLVGRKVYEKNDYSLVIMHMVSEMINSSYPAERNTTHYKTMYFPKVDQFTELRSDFTQSLTEIPNTTVRVWLEFPAYEMRSESRIMLYKYNESSSKNFDYIVGSRAITVVLEEGVFKEMYWDDTCAGCIEELCLEDSCASVIGDLRPTCHDSKALEEDPYRCGVKIYIAWKGTDRNNNTLSTYTSVPSRFQKYSFIATAYDAAAGFTSDFISFWKKPLN